MPPLGDSAVTNMQSVKTDLQGYNRDKFALAEILRSISNGFSSQDRPRQERLRELFIRLAEDRFNLVVVGRFNRGKTSIMNSIIGTDRLPVGIVPLTSVITTVTYGTEERVVLKFKRSGLIQDIPIGDLSRYVTQDGNPGNVRGIDIAEVQLRAEILRRGFYFVDTPGLGSAIIENTRTTEAFLPEADAFLIVTSYDSPLTEEEVAFLRSVSSTARRVFLVVNKHDTVSADERDTVLAYVGDQLRVIFSEATPHVFSVSANEGLQAKLANDVSQLAASGIPALEEALIDFLLSEKKDQFLVHMCRRVADLIRDVPPAPNTAALSTQISTLSQRLAQRDRNFRRPDAAIAKQQDELPSLQQFRTCEICTHVSETLWNFQCAHQYDISADDRKQKLFVASGGLCSFHAWEYYAVVSPYGVCTAYPALLDHLAAWLRRAAGDLDQNKPRATTSQIPVATPDRCMLCNVRDQAESQAISNLANRLSKQVDDALRSLSAICMPHLAILSSVIQNPDLVRQLMNHQAALLEWLSEDMKGFALKQSATRRHLENKEEMTAAERAVLLVAGHRNVTAGRAYRTHH
jgi:small GTP-binding protein